MYASAPVQENLEETGEDVILLWLSESKRSSQHRRAWCELCRRYHPDLVVSLTYKKAFFDEDNEQLRIGSDRRILGNGYELNRTKSADPNRPFNLEEPRKYDVTTVKKVGKEKLEIKNERVHSGIERQQPLCWGRCVINGEHLKYHQVDPHPLLLLISPPVITSWYSPLPARGGGSWVRFTSPAWGSWRSIAFPSGRSGISVTPPARGCGGCFTLPAGRGWSGVASPARGSGICLTSPARRGRVYLTSPAGSCGIRESDFPLTCRKKAQHKKREEIERRTTNSTSKRAI